MKEKTNYNKLTADELEALLTERLAAGDIDTIREIFFKTMQNPYLCKSAAQRNALPDDLYVRMYFDCVAAKQIGLLFDYFQTIGLKAGVVINYRCFCGTRFRDIWNFMRVVSDTHQNTTEAEYKKIVPALDFFAKGASPSGYISYEEGTGVYKVEIGRYIGELRENRDTALNLASILRTVTKAVEDTIEALGISNIISADLIAQIEDAKSAVQLMLKTVRDDYAEIIGVCNQAFVLSQIEGNKGYLFFTAQDLEETKKEYAEIIDLEKTEIDTETYNRYLVLFGDSKYYVYKAVFDYLTKR